MALGPQLPTTEPQTDEPSLRVCCNSHLTRWTCSLTAVHMCILDGCLGAGVCCMFSDVCCVPSTHPNHQAQLCPLGGPRPKPGLDASILPFLASYKAHCVSISCAHGSSCSRHTLSVYTCVFYALALPYLPNRGQDGRPLAPFSPT